MINQSKIFNTSFSPRSLSRCPDCYLCIGEITGDITCLKITCDIETYEFDWLHSREIFIL